MHDKEPFFSTKHLHIMSYDLYPLTPDGTIAGKRLMTFSGEPRPEVYFNLLGHLDNGKYGFIHVTELPAGTYLLAGWRHGSPGYAMPGVGGGVTVVPGTRGSQTGTYFIFEVKPGRLNYVGEILTISLSGVEVYDQFERDFKFAHDKNPELEKVTVVKQLAARAWPKQK
jgi:hypothetical protein